MITMNKHVIGHTEDGKEIVEVTRQIHTRKMDRRVANNVYKARGFKKYRKHGYDGATKHEVTRTPSYFAEKWREYACY